MLPLLVKIENTQTSATNEAVFTNSPVRIGRNQLNDLVLNESFVSQWHAIVRFDHQHTVYVDLGSTNGTVVNGHRVPKNVEVPIHEQVDLRIGPVRMWFSRGASAQQQDTSQPPGRLTVGPGSEPKGFQKTVFMQVGQVGAQQAAQAPRAADMSAVVNLVGQTKPYYDAYRQAFGSLLQLLTQQLHTIPEHARESVVRTVLERFPQLGREAEFRDLVTRMGVPPAVLPEADAGHFIQRLTTGDGAAPAARPQSVNAAMERVGAILEVFSQAYVELRKGYEQFGSDMAVQVTHDPTPLRQTQDAQQVLRYLLDWNADAGGRIQELTKAFADLALHQVAMLNGVVEGVRGLLQGMSPQAVSGTTGEAITKPGLLAVIWPFRYVGLWSDYCRQFRNVYEEDRFAREVFGKSFAKAYYMVTGGKMEDRAPTGLQDRTMPPNSRAHLH